MERSIETITLTAQMIYAQHRINLPAIPENAKLEVMLDHELRHLVLQLHAYIWGKEGERVTASRAVTEACFPRWVPKWLQRRWSRPRLLSIEETPILVYPDLELPEQYGRTAQIVRTDGPYWR